MRGFSCKGMNRLAICLFALVGMAFSPAMAAGGTIQGTVQLVPGTNVTEVVVSIENFRHIPPAGANGTKPAIDQKNMTFVPHTLPVVVGTTVELANTDSVFHNVYALSEAATFNYGIMRRAKKKVTFDKPGIVPLQCNVHSEMRAFVLVKENPFFAVPDKTGAFVIQGVPPGTYKLQAWHEKFEPVVKEITVGEGQPVTVEFHLDKRR